MTKQTPDLGNPARLLAALSHLAQTVDSRAGADPEASYTARLISEGPAQCAKKLGEEAVETILAIAAESGARIAAEAADLLYHLFVALRSREVSLDMIASALEGRQGASGLAEKAGRVPS
ncbi:MAG: phosphoribosyl-ATP diphosphatase [Alphaproteobacteria bacterium]|nr:phosphoribosyl-ATP diphosphatase [Alphaproteobacteria bacterium]